MKRSRLCLIVALFLGWTSLAAADPLGPVNLTLDAAVVNSGSPVNTTTTFAGGTISGYQFAGPMAWTVNNPPNPISTLGLPGGSTIYTFCVQLNQDVGLPSSDSYNVLQVNYTGAGTNNMANTIPSGASPTMNTVQANALQQLFDLNYTRTGILTGVDSGKSVSSLINTWNAAHTPISNFGSQPATNLSLVQQNLLAGFQLAIWAVEYDFQYSGSTASISGNTSGNLVGNGGVLSVTGPVDGEAVADANNLLSYLLSNYNNSYGSGDVQDQLVVLTDAATSPPDGVSNLQDQIFVLSGPGTNVFDTPEPASVILLSLGIAGIAGSQLRNRKRSAR